MRETINNDYSHTLLEQEEMHFYSCVHNVAEAFLDHGVKDILKEVDKNPKLHQQLVEYFKNVNTKV
jgi:hypothetical protein